MLTDDSKLLIANLERMLAVIMHSANTYICDFILKESFQVCYHCATLQMKPKLRGIRYVHEVSDAYVYIDFWDKYPFLKDLTHFE